MQIARRKPARWLPALMPLPLGACAPETAEQAETPPEVAAPLPVPRQLAPSGNLRVAIGVGSASSAFWATPDSGTGEPRGVTVDLGRALGERAGVPVELVAYPSSGAITEAEPNDEWDVTFMPVDSVRATLVDFGPAYYLTDSAILVPAGSAVQTLADVDRAGTRVAAVEGTTTARAAEALFPNATMVYYQAVDPLLEDVRAGNADAVALGRESLLSVVETIPGSRILEEGYNETGVAVAVPKGHAAALAYVSAFIEDAKRSGVVEAALLNAGIHNPKVAPPAP